MRIDSMRNTQILKAWFDWFWYIRTQKQLVFQSKYGTFQRLRKFPCASYGAFLPAPSPHRQVLSSFTSLELSCFKISCKRIHSVCYLCVCVCMLFLSAQFFFFFFFSEVKSLSCVGLFATPWTVAYQAALSLGKNTGVGCHFLLQGIFPTQGLKPGLPHCRQMLYPLSHQGNPVLFCFVFNKRICFFLIRG